VECLVDWRHNLHNSKKKKRNKKNKLAKKKRQQKVKLTRGGSLEASPKTLIIMIMYANSHSAQETNSGQVERQ